MGQKVQALEIRTNSGTHDTMFMSEWDESKDELPGRYTLSKKDGSEIRTYFLNNIERITYHLESEPVKFEV